MSAHIPCSCPGSRKTKMAHWYVLEGYYKTNYSWFEKPSGRAHRSDYSTVCCSKCHMVIRTKAKYVEQLPVKKVHRS